MEKRLEEYAKVFLLYTLRELGHHWRLILIIIRPTSKM